jgi:magnesium-transporting ATPase (P-type)
LGLAFFENPVKHDTLSTIQQLNEVELRSTMITGDNIHTAIDVAIQTQIISEKSNLGIVKYDEKTKTVTIELIESKNGFERIRINSETDHPIDPKIFNNNQNNSNQPEKENSLSVIVNIPFKTDTQTQIQEFV